MANKENELSDVEKRILEIVEKKGDDILGIHINQVFSYLMDEGWQDLAGQEFADIIQKLLDSKKLKTARPEVAQAEYSKYKIEVNLKKAGRKK